MIAYDPRTMEKVKMISTIRKSIELERVLVGALHLRSSGLFGKDEVHFSITRHARSCRNYAGLVRSLGFLQDADVVNC